jgi:GNAT superfamily N-acetyltransferase
MSERVYKCEDFFDILPELQNIFPLHYDELCVTKDFPLDPDYDQYKRINDAKLLACVTCRCDDELIGYIVFFLQPHIHYRTCLTAFEDMYFVKPEYRKGRLGIRLFQYAEKVLKEIGINRIILHTKVHLDNSRLFEYLGYKNSDKIYTKLL